MTEPEKKMTIEDWCKEHGVTAKKSWTKRFEFVRKSPGFKIAIRWGRGGGISFYFGTNTHPWGKVYFFWY